VPLTPHLVNSCPSSEYHSQSMNCIVATKFGLLTRDALIMRPFSSFVTGSNRAPAGPLGNCILSTVAVGMFVVRPLV